MKQLFLPFLTFLMLFSVVSMSGAETDQITVHGIGYPPIRAQNRVQARLLARRAAILDAYRNALKAAGATEDEEQKDFYSSLSGFIRGSETVREEYLSDGGVEVTLKVPSKEMIRAPRKDIKEGKSGTEKKRERKPVNVTVEEWYKVVDGIIKYE